jgi:uncharacterized membrane protein YdjX (TVP38/TMEM64 family)
VNKRKKQKDNNATKLSIQNIAVIVFIAVMTLVTLLCIPLINLLQTPDGRLQIKETVGKMPVLSVILYIILQAVQIIVAIIPGGPMQLLGGMLFGKLFGFLFCILGTLLGTVAVYYLVKLIGSPLVEAFVAKKNFKTLRILENQRRLEILVFVMFLIPGIPKDALTYLVPLTKLPAERFFVLSTVARAPAIFMSIMVGDSLSKGNFIQSVVFFLILVAIATIGVLYKDKVIGAFKNQKEKLKHK